MLNIRRVVVGISGGVDSAVATILLKKRGYDVQALFMQNWDIADETGFCSADADFNDASYVCDKLQVPLHRVNFVKQYWNEVFTKMVKDYQEGYTPNPDVLCNKYIKFNHFFHYAKTFLNADAIATGHYAQTNFGPYLEKYHPDEKVRLYMPCDKWKDQTLFLCQIGQEALRKTMFPLSEMTKSEARKIAVEHGLQRIAEKKESMGICFIGNREFKSFIAEYIENTPGNFVNVDTGEVVGTHDGIHQWTLGQRCNIGGQSDAFFVAKKRPKTNTIYVAQKTTNPALFSQLLYTSAPHWIHSQPDELKVGDVLECDFKYQHIHPTMRCQAIQTTKGLVIILEHSVRSIAPGQYAVLYRDGECLGSARIVSPGPSNFILNLIQNNKANFKTVSKVGVHRSSSEVNGVDSNKIHVGNESNVEFSEKCQNDGAAFDKNQASRAG